MKLVVEIGDFEREGKLEHFSFAHVEPSNGREGISTLDKSNQVEKLARLIDLSDVVKEAVERFYQERTISSPSSPIRTSGEPGTT